ncbi:MAG: c-type cytochrome [Acidobacteriota bacterium]
MARAVEDGRDTYRFYCASCHGPDGKGDGPIASALQTRPADLTRLAGRNAGTFPGPRVKTFRDERRRNAAVPRDARHTRMGTHIPLVRALGSKGSRRGSQT